MKDKVRPGQRYKAMFTSVGVLCIAATPKRPDIATLYQGRGSNIGRHFRFKVP